MESKMLKRCLKSVLAFTLALGTVQYRPHHTHAAEVESTTDAQVIVNNYTGLKTNEKNILGQQLNTTPIQFVKPTDDDGLITVDPVNTTITAEDYPDGQGNTWEPVKAIVTETVAGQPVVHEITEMTDGVFDFDTTTDNYTVQVVYKAYVEITKDTQYRLLNTPYWLVSGTDAVELLSDAIDYFIEPDLIDTGYGFPNLINDFNTVIGMIELMGQTVDESFKKAVVDLKGQLDANDGKFDVNVLNDEYNSYANGLMKKRLAYYYSEKLTTFKNEIADMLANLQALNNDTYLNPTYIPNAEAIVDAFDILIPELEGLLSSTDNDNWTALEKGKATLIGATISSGLENAVSKASNVNPYSMGYITSENLLLGEATVETSVNQNTVTVQIVANVVGEDNQLTSKQIVKSIKLANGTSKAALIAAVDAETFEEDALAAWLEQYNVGTTNFDRTTNEAELGDTLTADVTYTITYTPKSYEVVVQEGETTVTVDGISGSHLYGTTLTLPSSTDALQSYIYTIDGTLYNQGDKIKVTEATEISRKLGKAPETDRLFSLIADDITYTLSEKTKEILRHPALDSLDYQFRLVDATDANITLNYVDGKYVVTAQTYESGIKDMTWVPAQYSIIKGEYDINTATRYDMVNGEATINESDIDGVYVHYALQLKETQIVNPITVTNELIKEWINTPAALVEEVKEVKKALDSLAEMAKPDGFLTMGPKVVMALKILKDDFNVPGKEEELQAVLNIQDKCLDTDDHLLVYKYITNGYLGGEGLASYYTSKTYGQKQYKEQLDTLIASLEIIKETDEFENVLNTVGFPELIDTIDEKLVQLKNLNLDTPNSNLLTDHEKFAELLGILVDAREVTTINSANGLYAHVDLSKNASNKVSVNVTVNAPEATPLTGAIRYQINHELTADDIQKIKDLIADLNNGVDSVHNNMDAYTLPRVGTVLKGDTNITVNWSPKTYKYEIYKENGQLLDSKSDVTYGQVTITLPAPTEAGIRYDYTVPGFGVVKAETNDVKVNILKDEFDNFFGATPLKITRVAVNVGKEKLENLVEEFNTALSGLNTKFVLVENTMMRAASPYKLVFRIDPTEVELISTKFMDIANALISGTYGYYAFGNETNAFFNRAAGEISLQAIIDALLMSGFSSETLHALFDENGVINQNVAPLIGAGDVLVGSTSDLTHLGGLILDTTLFVGDNATAAKQELGFFISLEDFGAMSAELASADALLELVRPYIEFDTEATFDTVDELNVYTTLPNKGYQALLAGMIVTGYADLSTVNDAKFKEFVEFIESQYNTIVNSTNPTVTATTIQNTLDMLGINRSVAAHADTINTALNAFRKLVYTKDATQAQPEDTLNGVFSADLSGPLNSLGIDPMLLDFFKDTTLTLPTNFTLTNVKTTTYEAIIVDAFNGSKEYIDRVAFSTNIANDIKTLDKNAFVVLTGPVAGNLKVNNGVIIDLNGQTVAGGIENTHADDYVKVFDSSFADGTVEGAIKGNVNLAGGKYTYNNLLGFNLPEDHLAEGYVMDANDYVVTELYKITKNGKNIIVEVTPDITGITKDQINVKYFATELALTLAMNYFTTTSLTIDGDKIVGLNPKFADMVGLYANSTKLGLANDVIDMADCAGITNFVNKLIAKFTAFNDLADSIETDGIIAEYDIETMPLSVGVDVKDNYLTAGIESNSSLAKTDTIVFKFMDQPADNKAQIVEVLREVADILTINASMNVTKVDLLAKDDIYTDLSGKFDGKLTLNKPEYTLLMATTTAYGLPNGAKKTALINAVKTYIKDGTTTELIAAMNKLTFADMYTALVKASNTSDSYAEMLETIGVEKYENWTTVRDMDAKLDAYVSVAMRVLNKLGVHDSTRKFSFASTTGIDTFERTNWHRFEELKLQISLFVAKAPCNHTYGAWYEVTPADCVNPGLEKRECTKCEHYETRPIDELGHDMIEVSRVDSTCHTPGSVTKECSRCGHPETTPLPLDSNNHEGYTATVVGPTCTEKGYTLHECVCGDSYKDTYVDELGHDYTWTVVTPSTCHTAGTEKGTCTRDASHTTTRPLPLDLTNHEGYSSKVVKPTCTEKGYTLHECVCGHSYKDTYVDELGHDTHIVGAKQPTCTEDGYTGDLQCKRCTTVIEPGKVIKATGHNYVDGTCTVCGDKVQEPTNPQNPTNPDTPNDPENPDTSDMSFVGCYSLIAILCLAILVVLKKKQALNR